MSFLKAEWRKLVLANYTIEPEILSKYVPFGTELDLWNGKCYVSLVGFMFLNTRLLGVKIPFHVNFEEVNLRFYVKRLDRDTWKRGVVFIKEIVPKPALTFVANTVYQENYETLPMQHRLARKRGNQIGAVPMEKTGQVAIAKGHCRSQPCGNRARQRNGIYNGTLLGLCKGQ